MINELLEKRWKTTYRVAKFLELAPFIKMIGVNGSMASGKIKEESDIDFLIITETGRIWTARAFITFLTHITGKRRYGKKIAGRICLNRYQATKSLEIMPHDNYHSKVFSKLVPIFDTDRIYEEYKNKNKWMEDFGCEIAPGSNKKAIKNSKILGAIRKFFEWILKRRFGDFLEKKLGNWQKKRILSDPRTKNAPKGRVRISDEELCFHPSKE